MLCRSFYKHMLNLELTYEDLEAVDPDYYKQMKWTLQNDITDVLDEVSGGELLTSLIYHMGNLRSE